MSNPIAAHSQNLYLGEPPSGAADYDRDLKQNFRIVDFIDQRKNNSVISDLVVTAGSGLTVNWAAGLAEVADTQYSIGSSSGSATDNSGDTNIHLANYVFVNSSGAVTISTSLPTTEYTPLSIVFTNAGAISKVVDCRKNIAQKFQILNKTTDYAFTVADCNGLTLITNTGASANIVLDLLASVNGMKAQAKCSTQISASTESIKLVANGIESIKCGTTTYAGYNTGTVSVTNGSAVVTGSGTTWSDNIKKGDRFMVTGNSNKYYILSVDSNTQITLTANYGQATESGKAYTISASLTSSVVGSIWELTCEVAGAWIASLKGVQPSFSAYMSAGMTSFSTSTNTLIKFDTKITDNNFNYDNTITNYRYSPTIPGRYEVGFLLYGNIRGNSTAYYLKLFKNGAKIRSLGCINGDITNYIALPFTLKDELNIGNNDFFQSYINVDVTNDTIEIIDSSSSLFWAKRISD
ncbi:MAG: hypothetical protein HY096_00270 [Nitrospinae bacterium]|nr:hypothetical protein [Nitrospinota bacterium]